MNWDLIIKLGIGIVGLVTATVVARHQFKEAKAKKAEAAAQEAGLAANPTRCLRHEERMSVIEEKAISAMKVTNEHFDGIEKRLEIIGSDVKTLLTVHIKP